jgi:glycosyltransferase involved in cell wall biosynthesis
VKVVHAVRYTAPAKNAQGVERVTDALSLAQSKMGMTVNMLINKDSICDLDIVEHIPPDADIVHYQGGIPEDFGHQTKIPWISTCHSGPPPLPNEIEIARKYRSHFVGVSKAVCKMRGFYDYVYNGLNENDFWISPKEDYYLWMGGTDWGEEKALFSTINLAKKLKIKLIVAGGGRNIHIIDHLKSMCDEKIKYVGMMNGKEKIDLLSKAKAMFMIGRVNDACPVSSIESMMCGTPVIARNAGAHPEMIKNGVSGYICMNDGEIAKAAIMCKNISSQKCREYAIGNFSSKICAINYFKVYERMIKTGTTMP